MNMNLQRLRQSLQKKSSSRHYEYSSITRVISNHHKNYVCNNVCSVIRNPSSVVRSSCSCSSSSTHKSASQLFHFLSTTVHVPDTHLSILPIPAPAVLSATKTTGIICSTGGRFIATYIPKRQYSSTSALWINSSSGSHHHHYNDIQITGVSEDVASKIKQYAQKQQTSTSLVTLMKTGRGEYLHKTYSDHQHDATKNSKVATDKILMQVAGFLRHELPIRLAHRIQDLERVPFMKEMKSVQQVKELYITSFLELISIDKNISSVQDEDIFAKMLEGIYERHSSVLVQMARGAFELRAGVRNGSITNDTGRVSFDMMEETHAFLDRFYISRIGIRVLIGQYLSLRQKPVPNYIGLICLQSSPYEIVKQAIDDAAFMCTRKYGDSPEVIITGRLDLTFPYVPTHLHYIMLELLKNSMRATVDWHGIDSDYPPIKVVIADGKDNEDVVIKVSDEGGGIPRSNMKKIWSYLFTTADPAIQEGMVAFNENVDHSVDSPLAGLGYGLPISRSYSRYFGGDLSLMSMEGYGTDAFVYLTRLGNTREPLPL